MTPREWLTFEFRFELTCSVLGVPLNVVTDDLLVENHKDLQAAQLRQKAMHHNEHFVKHMGLRLACSELMRLSEGRKVKRCPLTPRSILAFKATAYS